jgi:hypothetical protein
MCPWYFDGSDTIKPFLLLITALFMLPDRWWGYLTAAVISGGLTVEGIIWVSRGSGFVSGLSRRIEYISTNVDSEIWQFLDWQYLLALIIFVIALGHLIVIIVKTRRNTINSY